MAAASASAAASSSAGPGTEKPAPGALLEAALRQCEHLTADPLQGSAALDVASDAAAALLRLAAQPAGHAAELERAVSAATAWAAALELQLTTWEAALGPQPESPEKSELSWGWPTRVGGLLSAGVPAPGSPRAPGTSAKPPRIAARARAAAVLILLDAAVGCFEALRAVPGAAPPPPEPHALEVAAARVARRLEDTGLFFAARAFGEAGEELGATTTVGLRAVGACCSLMARLLRLALPRKDALQAARRAQAEASASSADPLAALRSNLGTDLGEMGDQFCAPQTLRQVMDTLYDAAVVLRYWVPLPHQTLGDPWRSAFLSYTALVELIWTDQCCLDGELLIYGMAPLYGKKFISYVAFAPSLAAHRRLAEGAAMLAARGSAAAADVAEWTQVAHASLNIMTESFATRTLGVVTGVASGGPDAGFGESGVSLVLERSAALLRALPDLLAAVGAPLTEPLPAPLADAPETAAAATAWRLRQVGCMLVQLISRACCTFNAENEELPHPLDYAAGGSRTLHQAQLAAALPLLPLLVRWPLDLAASCGGAFTRHSQLPWELLGPGSHRLWVEWQVAVERLAGFVWCLGEEVEAGAAGAARGSALCPDGEGSSVRSSLCGLVQDADAAAAAAQRARAWPARDPAALASAAAAVLLLLSRWHTMCATLVPSPSAATYTGLDVAALRLQRRLPKACRQLTAAAGAALDAARKSRVLLPALPAALDAAATACKLVRLAACDAAHWALLGAAAAGNVGVAAGSPSVCEPYRPVALALAAAGAAERCMRRLLLAPGVLAAEEAAYLRRRALALALQLISALEAAAAATGPLAEQAHAAMAAGAPAGAGVGVPNVPRLLAALLQAAGACAVGGEAAVLQAGSLDEALAAARSLAGPPAQQALALAMLPCANPACMAPAPAAGEAALNTRRCAGCEATRYCSAQCAVEAWPAHKACCRAPADLAAAEAAAPARPPADWPAPPKRQRARACPVCGLLLAAVPATAAVTGEEGLAAAGEEHEAACAAARHQGLVAARAEHHNDPMAAAAVLGAARGAKQAKHAARMDEVAKEFVLMMKAGKT